MVWVLASYPDGYVGTEVWGTLNSRLEAGWQDSGDAIEGIRESTVENIWHEMDKIMLSLHPMHTRRMKFLSMKPTKHETASYFIHSIKEQAIEA